MKKVILNTCFILAIILFVVITIVLDFNNILTKYDINISAWASFLGSVIAVLGTYLITNHSIQKQIKNQNVIWDDEKVHSKENMYRSMNKQNIEYFYKELENFIDRLEYVGILKNIEVGLIEYDLFLEEYKEVDEYNQRFLKSVVTNYYYDTDIVKICEKALANKLVDFSNSDVWKLYHDFRKFFFGYGDRKEKEKMFDSVNRNAFMKLYEKLFLDLTRDGLKQKMNVYLSNGYRPMYYILRKNIEIYFEFINDIRKVIELNSTHQYSLEYVITILNCVRDSNEDNIVEEVINRINSIEINNEFSKNIKSLIESYGDKFLEIKMSVDECYDCREDLLNYGENTTEEIEKYLQLVERKFYLREAVNYTGDFILPNRYY